MYSEIIFSVSGLNTLSGFVRVVSLSWLCPVRVVSCPGYVRARVVSVQVVSFPGYVLSKLYLSGLCLSGLCPSTQLILEDFPGEGVRVGKN